MKTDCRIDDGGLKKLTSTLEATLHYVDGVRAETSRLPLWKRVLTPRPYPDRLDALFRLEIQTLSSLLVLDVAAGLPASLRAYMRDRVTPPTKGAGNGK